MGDSPVRRLCAALIRPRSIPLLLSVVSALLIFLASINIAWSIPSDQYFCGSNWSDANAKCAIHCPHGMDSECPPGERCYADCTNCPPGGREISSVSRGATTTYSSSKGKGAAVVNPGGDDSRMIAYLGNWQSCPTRPPPRERGGGGSKVDRYTHIFVGFAVTYHWTPDGNVCDPKCRIRTPVATCENRHRPDLIEAWRSAGTKVLISFGGAGMGGSWDGDPNDCWEHCYGREEDVVSQLSSIVRDQNFDGVDVDYEYYYEDDDFSSFEMRGRGRGKGRGRRKGLQSVTGSMARTFLDRVTSGLKARLPRSRNLVTHAPMDSNLVPGSSYYQILKSNAARGNLDFLMVQYYNGIVNTAANGLTGSCAQYPTSALNHYDRIVSDMFSGDPTRVVFGFCISDCGAYNIDGVTARHVMSELAGRYPCHGGAYFWVAENDVEGNDGREAEGNDGAWSAVVNMAIQPLAGCSAEPSAASSAVPVPPARQPARRPSSSSLSSSGTGAAETSFVEEMSKW